MPVIDQNQDPVDRNSLGLDISSFISEYEYPLTLQWVIEHSCYFYMEIAKMLCDVQNELKCIYNPDMQLESVVKNVITVSYTNNKNIKVFMAHFIERFKKQFLEFLKQCEKNVQFLQKTVTCKKCHGAYTLLATKLCIDTDGYYVICPVCDLETKIDIGLDENPLLHIDTIYATLV